MTRESLRFTSDNPADIRAVYLRQPDAQINWARRASHDRPGATA